MVRQNPLSNSQETSDAGDPEFARWLTRDLRPKGAPLSSPPSSSPSAAPAPSEAEVLASWLARDLTPKNSLRPRGSAPPSAPVSAPLSVAQGHPAPSSRPPAANVPPPAPLPLSPFRDVRDSEAPLALPQPLPRLEAPPVLPQPLPRLDATPRVEAATLDSLAPQEVPEPAALPVVAPASLDEDDLAVLPGRRRAAGSDRKKYAFVLLGVLCFAAAIVVGFNQRAGSDAAGAASLASPTDVGAALPPPPPSADDVPAAPEPAPEAPRARRAGAPSEEPDDGLDPLDPRNMIGGPSVRRYADVPSPTLSRLAREQRRLQRERDEAVRKAKMKEIPR